MNRAFRTILVQVVLFTSVWAQPTPSPSKHVTPTPTGGGGWMLPTPIPSFVTAHVSTYEELAAAFGTGGVNVIVEADIVLEGQVAAAGDVTMDGHGRTLDGQGTSKGIYVGPGISVTVRNVTLARCFDGAIFATGARASIVLVDSRVVDCTSSNGHPQILVHQGATAEIIRCTVMKNQGGPALAVYHAASLEVSQSQITHNTGTFGGGFGVQQLGVLKVFDSVVAWNTAGNRGGGLFVSGAGVFSIVNTTVSHNTGGDFGGGIFVDTASWGSVTRSRFVHNTANTASGGGMHADNSKVTLEECKFDSNDAAFRGGGISVDAASEVTVHQSTITNNQALEGGGGLFMDDSGSETKLSNTTISFNKAIDSSGGGYYIAAGTMRQLGCEIYNNSAITNKIFTVNASLGHCTAYGGCFKSQNYPNTYLHKDKCTFLAHGDGTLDVKAFSTYAGVGKLTVNGTAYTGLEGPDCVDVHKGEIIYWDPGPWSNTLGSGFDICYKKEASGGGGFITGADISASSLIILESTYRNNTAVKSGGGLRIANGAVSIARSSMFHNIAESGTAVYFSAGSFDGSDVDISGDMAGPLAEAGATCESACPAGSFGTCSTVPGASSCSTHCGDCVPCPVGTASATVGATSANVCVSCGAGQAATKVGQSSCTPCPRGRFAANSSSDFDGGQVVQRLSGASYCQVSTHQKTECNSV